MTDTTVTCLICDWTSPEEADGGAVPRHLVDPALLGNLADYAEKFGTAGVVCLGSGHTGRHDDGRDDARRFGIRQVAYHAHQLEALSNKAAGLRYSRAMDWIGGALLEHEHLDAMWRVFAIHGEWHTGVREALGRACRPDYASSPTAQAVKTAEADAAVQWLRAARHELGRHYREGVPADEFTTMLFNI